MYLIDRGHPLRHIHIKYSDYEAVMELVNLSIVDGNLPKPSRSGNDDEAVKVFQCPLFTPQTKPTAQADTPVRTAGPAARPNEIAAIRLITALRGRCRRG